MQIALQIKEKYLNEIIAGVKPIDYRECKPFYISRFCELNKKGEIDSIKKFDTIKLYVGNVKDGRYVVCECIGIFLTKYEKYIPEGMKKGDILFEIELGKILEHK